MSLEPRFRPLDGTVTLDADQPAGWAERVNEFYRHPNSDEWKGDLGRVLYHESVHWWQVLSSGYVANLVQEDWAAVLRFEAGEPAEIPDAVRHAAEASSDEPFSANELMECWARYWDVHTRSPSRLLAEDGLSLANVGPRPDHGLGIGPYSAGEFDAFMQDGPDATLYARPYRWALAQLSQDSRLLNLVFPPLVFEAFGSPNPVALFTRAVMRVRDSQVLAQAVRNADAAINIAWMQVYKAVVSEACRPTRANLGMPSFTGGAEVIEFGRAMVTHPMYRIYRGKLRILAMRLPAPPEVGDSPSVAEAAHALCCAHALADPGVMFMFPGQPTYRAFLGNAVPPPRVVFRDAQWCCGGGPGILTGKEDTTFAPVYAELEPRLTAFYNARYAARLGVGTEAFRQLARE
jgi:hypothetical protein